MKHTLTIRGYVSLLLLLALGVISQNAFAQSSIDESFRQGFKTGADAAAQQRAAEDQARREAAQQKAEQERQRQSYDLQLRNQREMEALRQKSLLDQQKQRENDQRLHEIDGRKAKWNQIVEELKNNFTTTWQLAYNDAVNSDYSIETHTAASQSMKKLTEQKMQLNYVEPDYNNDISFRSSISQLPIPQLGYTPEYSKKYLDAMNKKTSSKKHRKQTAK